MTGIAMSDAIQYNIPISNENIVHTVCIGRFMF